MVVVVVVLVVVLVEGGAEAQAVVAGVKSVGGGGGGGADPDPTTPLLALSPFFPFRASARTSTSNFSMTPRTRPRLSMNPLTATRSMRFVLARYSVSKTVWPDDDDDDGSSVESGGFGKGKSVLLLLSVEEDEEAVEMGDVGGVMREKVR